MRVWACWQICIRQAQTTEQGSQQGPGNLLTVGSVEFCSADLQGCHNLRTTSIWILRAQRSSLWISTWVALNSSFLAVWAHCQLGRRCFRVAQLCLSLGTHWPHASLCLLHKCHTCHFCCIFSTGTLTVAASSAVDAVLAAIEPRYNLKHTIPEHISSCAIPPKITKEVTRTVQRQSQ